MTNLVTSFSPAPFYQAPASQIPMQSQPVYAPAPSYQDSFQNSMDTRLGHIDRNLAALKAPGELMQMAPPVQVSTAGTTVGPSLPYYSPAPSLPIQQNAPSMTQQTAQYSPYVPTLTTLSISRDDLQWALQLEEKVKNQNYQPTPQETARYQALASQLESMQNNIQPLTPAQPLPVMQNYGSTTPVPQQPMAGQPAGTAQIPPGTEMKQVTMSEIEWALMIEEKVQKRSYQPTPDEEARYQNILARFKANPKIKVGILDALSAQSPWIGANVATIKFSKPISGSVSQVISAIKGGGGLATAVKGLGLNVLKSTGLSAVVSGGFSAVTNIIAVMRGERTKTQAIANVASDTVSGAVTGLGATLAGGLAMTALAATSIVGWPLTLLIGGASVLGGYLADKLFTKSGAKSWIKTKVYDMIDKPKSSSQPALQATPIPAG